MPIEKEDGYRLIKSGVAYTTVTNDAMSAISSPVALAIWLHLCSKPKEWLVRRTEIMERFGIGKDKYQDSMRELRQLGLVWDYQARDPNGSFVDKGVVCSNALPVNSTESRISPSTGFDGLPNLPKDGSAERRQIRPPSNKRVISKEIDISNEISVPEGINAEAWQEWADYRKSRRKPVSQSAAVKQFKLLGKYTETEQRQVIDQSISNDYQGLFELRRTGSGAHQQPNQPRPDNSAAGRVRAAVERERAAERAAAVAMADDGINVRPQMGEQLRGGSGPGPGMGVVLEGDFSRAD